MDVSFQNISVQEVPLEASTCSKIGTLKSAAMEAFECFPKKMSTKLWDDSNMEMAKYEMLER